MTERDTNHYTITDWVWLLRLYELLMSIPELLAYMNMRGYASGMLLCHQINCTWFGVIIEPSSHAKMHIIGNSAIGWWSRPWQKKQHASGLDTAVLVQARRLLASLGRNQPEIHIGDSRVDEIAALFFKLRCR